MAELLEALPDRVCAVTAAGDMLLPTHKHAGLLLHKLRRRREQRQQRQERSKRRTAATVAEQVRAGQVRKKHTQTDTPFSLLPRTPFVCGLWSMDVCCVVVSFRMALLRRQRWLTLPIADRM